MLEAQKTQPGHRAVPRSPASMLVWDLPLAETLWGFQQLLWVLSLQAGSSASLCVVLTGAAH